MRGFVYEVETGRLREVDAASSEARFARGAAAQETASDTAGAGSR